MHRDYKGMEDDNLESLSLSCEIGEPGNPEEIGDLFAEVDLFGGEMIASIDELLPTRGITISPTREGSRVSANQEEAAAIAESEGFEVIRGGEQTILLDLDDDAAISNYTAMLGTVQRNISIREASRWPSKDNGLHVRLELSEPMPTTQRLLLQACLGSDPVKEFLSLVRLREGTENPTMLFKPTGAGKS